MQTLLKQVERTGPLLPNWDQPGSQLQREISVEWTPSSTGHVPIRSTWRDAIGPILTNRRITARAKQGFYGKKWRELALAKTAKQLRAAASGIVHRCINCGRTEQVRHVKYAHLPQAGNWCELCLSTARAERDKLAELARRVKVAEKQRLIDNYT